MNEQIKVVVCLPDKRWFIDAEFPNNLNDFQTVVKGPIEVTVHPAFNSLGKRAQNIRMIVNEEGLLRQLPINENLLPFFYVGAVIFVGVEGENFRSLTRREIHYVECVLDGLGVDENDD